jgi:molecular chaperone IbpA
MVLLLLWKSRFCGLLLPLDASRDRTYLDGAKALQELGNSGAGGCPVLLWLRCSPEDVAMRYDFSPFYRSTVGFDRLFDMLDQANRVEPMTNWPPYNIEKTGDDGYRITMAVAGFGTDEIEVTQHENTLLVSGQKRQEQDGTQVLHRGIATRAFKQTFNLADHVKVTGAGLENGLLTIELLRQVPEELRPRRIEIATGNPPQALAQDNAKKGHVRQIEQDHQSAGKAA